MRLLRLAIPNRKRVCVKPRSGLTIDRNKSILTRRLYHYVTQREKKEEQKRIKMKNTENEKQKGHTKKEAKPKDKNGALTLQGRHQAPY